MVSIKKVYNISSYYLLYKQCYACKIEKVESWIDQLTWIK